MTRACETCAPSASWPIATTLKWAQHTSLEPQMWSSAARPAFAKPSEVSRASPTGQARTLFGSKISQLSVGTSPVPCTIIAPPATRTVPSCSRVAVCAKRARWRSCARVQVPDEGSNSSALFRNPVVLVPPTTSTWPPNLLLASNVAVHRDRSILSSVLVSVHVGIFGRGSLLGAKQTPVALERNVARPLAHIVDEEAAHIRVGVGE
jgi:hypothetical protein